MAGAFWNNQEHQFNRKPTDAEVEYAGRHSYKELMKLIIEETTGRTSSRSSQEEDRIGRKKSLEDVSASEDSSSESGGRSKSQGFSSSSLD
jgi:hypothetical protein